ncbi:MAG: hypothetical protein R3F61_02855 [Myxococcota bacterium]
MKRLCAVFLLGAPSIAFGQELSEVEAETTEIEARVNKSKSTLDELRARMEESGEPAPLRFAKAPAVPGYRVDELVYLIDGVMVDPASATVRPGEREITASAVLRGDGSASAYMGTYAFRLQASTAVHVKEGVPLEAALTVSVDPTSKRPSLALDARPVSPATP